MTTDTLRELLALLHDSPCDPLLGCAVADVLEERGDARAGAARRIAACPANGLGALLKRLPNISHDSIHVDEPGRLACVAWEAECLCFIKVYVKGQSTPAITFIALPAFAGEWRPQDLLGHDIPGLVVSVAAEADADGEARAHVSVLYEQPGTVLRFDAWLMAEKTARRALYVGLLHEMKATEVLA